ncbi:MAG: thiamine pyrophosphate-dependent enzyme, partial [Burkholderiales bacterium]
VWKLPVVFVVANNQWAISVPLAKQTATQTLAQKAIAAGIEGVQVDGNDIIAVSHALQAALKKARTGVGPALIEALTYRLFDHTTADDARRYRSTQEVSKHWALEPIVRLRNYLADSGAWGKQQEEQLLAECARQVQAAADEFTKLPKPAPAAMFEHLYATLPAALQAQRDDALREQ